VAIWSSSYDRELKDVFAVQEDIARSIATSLHMTLGLKPGESLVNERTKDPQLHDDYLRAVGLSRAFRADEAVELFNKVVARDPQFAPAWAGLAGAHQRALLGNLELRLGVIQEANDLVRDHLAKRDAAAEQAVKLDPDSADALCALGTTRSNRGDHIAAVDLKQRGVALDPDNPDCLQLMGLELARLGFAENAAGMMNHLLAIEPFVPVYRGNTARVLWAGGQTDTALRVMMKGGNPALLAQIYAAQGRYKEAADALAATPLPDNPVIARLGKTAVQLLRAAPRTAPPDSPELGTIDWVYLYAGAPERFMNSYETALRIGFQGGAPTVFEWAPEYHSIRQTARFKQWIRNSGIYAYWRTKGWPPQCHPTTSDDFECN
jgi:tetratricopeptide (TPR) repeat protein